jgi:myo-inositol-1(or 4)-monophosphatase
VNDIRLPLSNVPQPFPKTLSSCLISLEYGSDLRPEVMQKKLETVTRLAPKVRGIRSLGSAALACCYVAKGSLDLYFEAGVHIWDISAGALIITEAGNSATLIARRELWEFWRDGRGR